MKAKGRKTGPVAIRLEMFESIWVIYFQNLTAWEHMFMQNDTLPRTHERTNARTHKQRDIGVMIISKI